VSNFDSCFFRSGVIRELDLIRFLLLAFLALVLIISANMLVRSFVERQVIDPHLLFSSNP